MPFTPKHFTPSSSNLLLQITAAEAKFAAAREQALLRKEARQLDRLERVMAAEAAAKSRIQRWGV